jgi:protein subunit release factor A
VGVSVHNISEVLAGDLDPFIDALLAEERRGQLSGGDGQAAAADR